MHACTQKMLTMLRNCHEGVRARVHTNNSEHSKWFDVTLGLRQAARQRINTVTILHKCCWLLAALHVIPVRFSKDGKLVRNMVQLNGATAVGPEG